MLNSETKRHIDAARDVLVGVAPNPMTQIDQITYALIYKFMDDMDQASINAGGEPSFFVGELETYAWSRLLDSRMGNQERMNLYGEALQKFSEAKQLPELFRTIFRAAFLPYRSPETLGLFLKEISHFDYSHPEELGNAYEYLLSIMSSQGDAGQFRTPRHIIDFMVDVMNPTKDDRVLDPACGTGGFLVATYNHILEQHDGKDDPNKTEQPLTPDERKKLMNNLEGYDIDPSMVRIAQVNMYLNQFKNPQIFQYDSLTSEERWNEKFDVILANPPFMSPKGGIKPHSKFALESSRSEVLFVDYIVNHLKPNGRAGIIVPEGIIFQSGKAYKQLRKELVEGGLYGVISLPAGVFNPYSGVKTSILLINSEIAKQRDEILFVKISADGYDLGATKRPIKKNDLPEAFEITKKFAMGEFKDSPIASLVSKTDIAKTIDYNLSGDRYSYSSPSSLSIWPIVRLGEVAKVSAGNSAPQGEENYKGGIFPFFRTSDVGAVHLSNKLVITRDKLTPAATSGMKLFPAGTILFPKSGASTFLNHRVLTGVDGYVSSHLATIQTSPDRLSPEFAYFVLTAIDAKTLTADQSYPSLRLGDIEGIEIPLPPLEIQEQVVSELRGYAAIIDGAKRIAESWQPIIEVDSEWPRVKLGDAFQIESGGTPNSQTSEYWDGGIPWATLVDIPNNPVRISETARTLSKKGLESSSAKLLPINTVLVSTRATIGRVAIADVPMATNQGFKNVIVDAGNDAKFVALQIQALTPRMLELASGGTFKEISKSSFSSLEISLPPIEVQSRIVASIEAEENAVNASKKLGEEFMSRTSKVISSLWHE